MPPWRLSGAFGLQTTEVVVHEGSSAWPVALTLGACGALYGLVIAVLAFFMAGGGHGWGEGTFSSAAILLVPLVAVAWVYRHHRAGPMLAGLPLIPAAYLDWFLATYTSQVDRVWQYMPGVLVLWVLLWLAWQPLALWALLCKVISRAEPRAGATGSR